MKRKVDATFYSDPSHGWYAVDVDEIKAYGLVEKISAFSYHDPEDGLVFLEEDCDATLFERAVRARGDLLIIHETPPSAGDSFVTRMHRYSAQVVLGTATY